MWITASVALCLALIIAFSWGRSFKTRWAAGRLLAVLQSLHPGETTKIEAERRLAAFASTRMENRADSKSAFYTIANDSAASGLLEQVSHGSFLPLLARLPLPQFTAFNATLVYREGLLSEVKISETNWGVRGFHSNASALMAMVTTRFAKQDCEHFGPQGQSYSGLPDGFSAYQINESNDLTDGFPKRESVILDEHATPQQRAAALDFRLACMTSLTGCTNARELRAAEQTNVKTFDESDIILCN